MAQNKGLLSELGLDVNPTTAGWQMAQQRAPQHGGSAFADAFAVGQTLGRGMAPGVGAIASGIGGLISGEGGRGFKEFGRDMAAGMAETKKRGAAQALGITTEQLDKREAMQKELATIVQPETGDAWADQIAYLDKVIGIANKHGDSEALMKAMQKKQALMVQKQAYDKAEVQHGRDKTSAQEEAEEAAAGRSLILTGDDPEGALSSGVYDPDKGWTIWRPDGSVMEGVDGGQIQLMDQQKSSSAKLWQQEDASLKRALDLNGYNTKAIREAKNEFTTFAETATIVGDMAGTLLDMYNPEMAFADSARIANMADRGLSFVDTVSKVFTTPEERQSKGYEITYGEGKNPPKVSAQKQYELATSPKIFQEWVEESGLDIEAIMPEHIRSDTTKSQLFIANMMQLAYLDARMQEPSNRGLSDNDIKAALQRIGADFPNPRVFALRWQQNLDRMEKRMQNLGMDIAGVGEITSDQMKMHLWPASQRAVVGNALAGTRMKLDEFLGERGAANTFEGVEIPDEVAGLDDASLEAEIAAEKARLAAESQ